MIRFFIVFSGLMFVLSSNLWAQENIPFETKNMFSGEGLLAFNEEYDYARNTKEDYLRDTTLEWQGRTLRDMGFAKLAVGGALLTTGIFFMAAKFDEVRDDYFFGGGIGLCLSSIVPIYYGFDDLAAARRIHPLSVEGNDGMRSIAEDQCIIAIVPGMTPERTQLALGIVKEVIAEIRHDRERVRELLFKETGNTFGIGQRIETGLTGFRHEQGHRETAVEISQRN